MLAGKICIVTGSTAGIGKAIAHNYLKQGAKVIICGRTPETVNKTTSEFAAEGLTDVIGIVANVGTPEGCETFFSEVDKTGLTVEVLVNCMGIFGVIDFFEASDEYWTNYMNTNIMSTVRLCRRYLKSMLERKKGRVIVVSSEAGVRSIGDMIPYSVTKAAQINFARGLAELTKGVPGVTVNSLLPGPTHTEGLDGFIDDLSAQYNSTREEAIAKFFHDREPTSLLQRFLTVDEVANVATFMASDLSSGINGATQRVEGGIIRSI